MNVEDFILNQKDNFVELDFQHAHQFQKKMYYKGFSHLRTNLRERVRERSSPKWSGCFDEFFSRISKCLKIHPSIFFFKNHVWRCQIKKMIMCIDWVGYRANWLELTFVTFFSIRLLARNWNHWLFYRTKEFLLILYFMIPCEIF